MYLQSIKSVRANATKSVNRSILKKSRHIGFGVFIVHSSMEEGLGHRVSLYPVPKAGIGQRFILLIQNCIEKKLFFIFSFLYPVHDMRGDEGSI
jgi:hypothetical protein